jgi:hypothetical protein
VAIHGLKGSGSTGISPGRGAIRKRMERDLWQSNHTNVCVARVLESRHRIEHDSKEKCSGGMPHVTAADREMNPFNWWNSGAGLGSAREGALSA